MSTLSVEAADATAAAARAAAACAQQVADRVDATVASLGGWYGVARDGFGDRAAELAGDLGALTSTAAAGAGLVAEYAFGLGVLQARLRRVDTSIAQVQARVDAGVGDLAAFHADRAELEHWGGSRLAVLADFDELGETFAARMFAVLDHVDGRPRRFGEHVDDAARTLADSARDSAYLAAGWAWDAPGWTATVRRTPAALLDAVAHPVRTLADAVAWDDWSSGRYGAGTATLGAAFVGRGFSRGGRLGKVLPEGHRWSRYLDADGNPLPQSVEELYAGVDLGRSEVFWDAHTADRHVEVDDGFLRRRLDTGAVEGGRVLRPPPQASRFADQASAEKVITDALRLRREQVDREIALGKVDVSVTAPAGSEAGVVWSRDGHGGHVRVPVQQVKVVLSRSGDGSWYVRTAYLEGSS
nr:RNase A-like domain-containing protein [Kineococcus aurantiacus]